MTNFTYQDLDSFAQSLNQAKDLLIDIEENMRGCYPDNDREPQLQAAMRQTQSLMVEAERLRHAVLSLWAKDSNERSAQAIAFDE